MNSINRLNTRLLLTKIKSDLDFLLCKFTFIKATKELSNSVTLCISQYLKNLSDKKIITEHYLVDSKLEKVTWKELYPDKTNRLLAILAYLLFKIKLINLEDIVYKWYHFVFPYNVEFDMESYLYDMKLDYFNENDNNEVEYTDNVIEYWEENKPNIEWITNWLSCHNVKNFVRPSLKIPYYRVWTNTTIQPVRAIDKVSISFKIDNMGN